MKTAFGTSMIPSVFPDDILEVKNVNPDEIKIGDILCYLGKNKDIIAHRVIRIEKENSKVMVVTKGDALDKIEKIPVTSAISVVKTVNNNFFSYKTNGTYGQMLAHFALKNGLCWRLAAKIVRLMYFKIYKV